MQPGVFLENRVYSSVYPSVAMKRVRNKLIAKEL